MTLPALDDAASRHFSYRDVCECSETWFRTRIENRPKEADSYGAIAALCVNVLDPIVEHFGPIELTYGFASLGLARAIGRSIAPQLDQHAGHERRLDGRLICPRLGQAVDLRVPGRSSHELARFIVEQTPFDRLYLYGEDRPVHVSYGPDGSRAIIYVDRRGSRPLPRRMSQAALLKLSWGGPASPHG